MPVINNKKLLSFIISLGIVGLIILYLYINHNIFHEIQNVKLMYLWPITTLLIGSLYVNGIILRILAKPFNIDMEKHFLLSISASFFNLITPFRGGAGIRAVYMKKRYELSYSHFVSSLFGNYIIVFLVSSFLALLSYWAIFSLYRIFNIYLFLIFLTIFLGTLVLITFNFSFQNENFLTKKINKVLSGWKLITNNSEHPGVVPKLILLTLLNLLIGTLIVKFSFLGIGLEINLLRAFYLAIMNVLAIFINITPGSFGITEGLYITSANIIGIDPALALIVALIIRAVNTTVLLVLGPIANHLLLKDLIRD